MSVNVPAYRYAMNFKRNHDGDTITIDLDLGCFTWIHDRNVRLYGINCPELATPAGPPAQQFTAAWFAGGQSFVIDTAITKDGSEKYGRLLGTIYRDNDPVSLNDALVAAGQAVVYMVK